MRSKGNSVLALFYSMVPKIDLFGGTTVSSILTSWKSSKRDDVVREIKMDEQEKDKLEHDISILHERLNKVVTNLARKVQIRDEYGKRITIFNFCYIFL